MMTQCALASLKLARTLSGTTSTRLYSSTRREHSAHNETLTQEEILKFIAHRPPFLLLTRITQNHFGQSAVGWMPSRGTLLDPRIEHDASESTGNDDSKTERKVSNLHIVEGMGQTGAAILAQAYPEKGIPVFVGMRSIDFSSNAHDDNEGNGSDRTRQLHDFADRSNQIQLGLSLTELRRGKLGVMAGQCVQNGRVICKGELLFAFIPSKK